MLIVGESTTHLALLDDWISEFLCGSLSIFYGFKHNKSVVEVLEKRPLDVDLAVANLLVENSEIEIGDAFWKVRDVNHLMGILVWVSEVHG